MEIWMDVDAALAEVPVNLYPLTDDTNFKTREVAVAYNAAGMDLVWNFVTTAGAFTQTAVTPTTGGGNYDWAHQGGGIYTIGIPASGGASINNDTEGFGWFTGVCDGVLPWRGPVIGFRAAGLNNALINTGTGIASAADMVNEWETQSQADPTGFHVNVKEVNGTAQTANDDAADINTILSRIIGTLAAGTHNPQSGDAFGRLGAPAGVSVSADIAAVAGSVPVSFVKNVAKNAFVFIMRDSTNHVPTAGLTVSCSISLDGAAFGGATNAVVAIGNGFYMINFTQAEMNADTIALRFTAAGADDLAMIIYTRS